ncbi:olfactory receptor 1468-like, partial [Sigmodon hispidus]
SRILERNQTVISEFLLLGLPISPEYQHLFYALFLTMYLTTILGNLIILILILLDSHLHTPMYLFLSNLSFSDLCFSSVTMPKLLQNMQTQDPSITYAGCLTQIYFLMVFGDMESFLLVVMAYDRYVAICFPLHYTSIMSPKLCVCLMVLCWVLTILYSMLHTLLLPRLSFCGNNVIPQFFCDISALLKLACSDIHINQLMIFIMGGLVSVIPFILIIVSYVQIVCSILKVSSTLVIHKVFSTCGSHLSVVTLFYGTIIGLYIFPSDNNSTVKETAMAMMCTVVTPMLNPYIYSLRNRDMKEVMHDVFPSLDSNYYQLCLGCRLTSSEHQHLFYALFLTMYLTTVLGNFIIIIVILLDSHLHTPMYLFLSNLSFSDLCFSSVTMPKLLQNMQSQKPSIPYAGCLAQLYFYLYFADLESFLLVVMAYDRYVAICFPLHYTSIMSHKLCAPSVRGINKVFSTCGSHLSAVSLFYGTIIGLYLCPSANNSTVKEIVMAMMYTVVTPMLNPFIYSLRNRDMKGALAHSQNSTIESGL